jgi:hypothetical protein
MCSFEHVEVEIVLELYFYVIVVRKEEILIFLPRAEGINSDGKKRYFIQKIKLKVLQQIETELILTGNSDKFYPNFQLSFN